VHSAVNLSQHASEGLLRFDSPCIFSQGDWKTRSVRWAEKQLCLLAASRAARQAAEEGHVCH